MKRHMLGLGLGLSVLLLSAAGCEEQANPVQATTPPPAPASQPAEPMPSSAGKTTGGVRQPALGRAKEATQNTLDEATRRQEEMMKELEDDG